MRAESTRFCPEGAFPLVRLAERFLPYRHYTAKAIAVCNADDSVDYEPYFPGSKADFVKALLILSTNLPQPRSIFGLGDIDIEAVEVAHLRCPFETWLAVFRAGQNVEEPRIRLRCFPSTSGTTDARMARSVAWAIRWTTSTALAGSRS